MKPKSNRDRNVDENKFSDTHIEKKPDLDSQIGNHSIFAFEDYQKFLTRLERNNGKSDIRGVNGISTEFRFGAVGDKPSDKVGKCRICANNGFPHEPVVFSPVYGRLLSNGNREVLGHQQIDYVTDRPHKHKEPKQQEGRYYLGWDMEAILR